MLRCSSARVFPLSVVLLVGCGGGVKTVTSTQTGSTPAPVTGQALARCLESTGYHVRDLGPAAALHTVDTLSLNGSTEINVYSNSQLASYALDGLEKEDVVQQVGRVGAIVYAVPGAATATNTKVERDIGSCAM